MWRRQENFGSVMGGSQKKFGEIRIELVAAEFDTFFCRLSSNLIVFVVEGITRLETEGRSFGGKLLRTAVCERKACRRTVIVRIYMLHDFLTVGTSYLE